jgi:uncharacterized membrane protein YphA (DoxX/SURF4 family)
MSKWIDKLVAIVNLKNEVSPNDGLARLLYTRHHATLAILVCDTPSPDRGLRFHGTRLRKTRARPGILHGNLARLGDACTAWTTILVELLGGFAVFVGAFIPIVSIPMVITLLVAIFTVHVPNGFSSIKLQSVDMAGAHFGQPGYETDLLYMAGLFAIVLGGSGRLALDRALLRRYGATDG